jgi:hypothetical protein
MMMIKPISIDQISQIRLSPAATVATPITTFKACGIAFSRDEDDLDSYEFAGFLVNGTPFGLLRYQHAPAEDTKLLFPEGAILEEYVAKFAKEFDLPLTSFHWRDMREATPA